MTELVPVPIPKPQYNPTILTYCGRTSAKFELATVSTDRTVIAIHQYDPACGLRRAKLFEFVGRVGLSG